MLFLGTFPPLIPFLTPVEMALPPSCAPRPPPPPPFTGLSGILVQSPKSNADPYLQESEGLASLYENSMENLHRSSEAAFNRDRARATRGEGT